MNLVELEQDDPGVELSSRRTGMSFQRTRMSADRTLMSVIRTSLSLITFGFTIYQFFANVAEQRAESPRHFGATLLALGVLMLVLGIGYHLAFMRGLRNMRKLLAAQGLIHAESGFPPSMTLIVAVLLLVLGVITGSSVVLQMGPFR